MKKLLILIIVVISIIASFIAGKNYGVFHSMVDAQISYYNGTVFIELDGQLYEHYAE